MASVVRYGPRISHLVAEIFDFDAAALSDRNLMRSVAEKIIRDLSLHLVEIFEGQFEPFVDQTTPPLEASRLCSTPVAPTV